MADVIVGVVVFPGSNCDHDTEYAAGSFDGVKPVMLWHNEHDLKGAKAIILPGGFSYGDYLRAGSIARFSPIMQEVMSSPARVFLCLASVTGFRFCLKADCLKEHFRGTEIKSFSAARQI